MKPYFSRDGITIYLGDCREILPQLSETVDLVLTDPPYGTGGWRRQEAGAGSNPSGSLVREDWDDGAVDWLTLVPCDVVMTFWPAAKTSHLLNAANERGMVKHRQLYWRKPDPKPQMGGRTQWSIEPIWVLSAEGFQLYGSDGDMCEASAVRLNRDAEATGHPYQKPIRVMRWALAKTDRGCILDPFMGSGSTLRAALDLGRRAVGIEQDERWCEVTARRLSQMVLPLGAA